MKTLDTALKDLRAAWANLAKQVRKAFFDDLYGRHLMRVMVRRPDFVKEKMLSDGQLDLFKTVKYRPNGVTSKFIADLHGVTVQSATTRLAILRDKGYLKRARVDDPTGGIMYIYNTTI